MNLEKGTNMASEAENKASKPIETYDANFTIAGYASNEPIEEGNSGIEPTDITISLKRAVLEGTRQHIIENFEEGGKLPEKLGAEEYLDVLRNDLRIIRGMHTRIDENTSELEQGVDPQKYYFGLAKRSCGETTKFYKKIEQVLLSFVEVLRKNTKIDAKIREEVLSILEEIEELHGETYEVIMNLGKVKYDNELLQLMSNHENQIGALNSAAALLHDSVDSLTIT